MRLTYLFKHDHNIKLIIGSTIIKENMFYNHGTLKSSTDNDEQLLNILSNFNKSISFPQYSPVIVKLKTNGILPEYNTRLEEDEDEFEELNELERSKLLIRIQEMKETLDNIINNPIVFK